MMKTNSVFRTFAFAAGFASLTAFVAPVMADDDDLQLKDCPVAVQETIKANLRGGTVDDIDRAQLDGRTIYKVEVELGKASAKNDDDDDLKLYINADGKLLKIREDIGINDLPATVKDAALKHVTGGKIDDVDREIADGQTTYRVEIDDDDDNNNGDDDVTLVLKEDGSVISRHSDD